MCPAIVSASPAQVVAGDTVNFSVTYSHAAGVAQINRAYFGLTNACSCDPGEANCSNFERQLAQSLAVFSSGVGSGGVGTNGLNAGCFGGAGGACPWTNFPASPLPLANTSNSATVNSVSFVNNGINRTYTWNVNLGTNFPAGTYNYYAMASDMSGHWQECGPAQWDKLTSVQVLPALRPSLTADHSSLVLMASMLGLPVQTLRWTVTGGSSPYNGWLYVVGPDNVQHAYILPTPMSAVSSFGPAEAYNADFGTDQKGNWRAWLTVRDATGHDATSTPVFWDVAFYTVHETP
jgi:hypothetical protein